MENDIESPVMKRINILRGEHAKHDALDDDAEAENRRWALSAILRSFVAKYPS